MRQHTNRPVSELRRAGFLCKSRLGKGRGTGVRRVGGRAGASNLERRETKRVGVALT